MGMDMSCVSEVRFFAVVRLSADLPLRITGFAGPSGGRAAIARGQIPPPEVDTSLRSE
jgi:nicotinamide mononucleotide (NMN) deamidase PncC